ncbi:hypothetical protein D1872_277630 [compost metagenome]
MCSLVLNLFNVFTFLKNKTGAEKRQMEKHVNLVKCHPVLHFILIAGEYCFGIGFKQTYQLPAPPASILLDQIHWHVKMSESNDWLNTMFMQLVEQIIVELQTCFIGSSVFSCWKNTSPGNGNTQRLKSHFCK